MTKKSLSLLFLAGLMTGCQSTQAPIPPFVPQQGSLNLAQLSVDLAFGKHEDSSAQWIYPSVSEQASQWANNRFVALGGHDVGRLTLKRVALLHKQFPKDDSSLFKKSPAEEFTLILEASLEVSSSDPNSQGSQVPAQKTVHANTVQTCTLGEGASLAEKQAEIQKLLNGGLQDLDRELTKTIAETMPMIVGQ